MTRSGGAGSTGTQAGWGRFALWAALAAAGHVTVLSLIDAGNTVRYQHLRATELLGLRVHPAAVAVIGLQLALATAVLVRRWPVVRSWAARHFRWWQLLGIALVVGLSSAAVSRDPRVYVTELALASILQWLNLATVAIAALALPAGTLGRLTRAAQRLLGPADRIEAPARIDRFAVLAAVWVTVVAATLCVIAYGRHPHVPDEVGYLLHARYFAEGRLWLPAPPVPEAFDVDLMTVEPARWYSPVPPGWPAVLALGVRLGVPWLVNPLLAGANIILAYLVLRELYPRRAARLSVLLLCVSPWYLFMGMNFMTHMLALACVLVAALAVARAVLGSPALGSPALGSSAARRGLVRVWLGGCAIGVVALIRPLEALAVAGLLGLWSLGARGGRFRFAPTAALALGAVMVGALTLPYNAALTGEPTRFPLMAYFDRYYGPGTNDLGFGPNRGLGWGGLDPFPGHGLRDVLVNANLNIFSVNVELLGWSTGSLVLIALVAFSRRMRRPDHLMLAAIAGVVGIHSFYYFSGGPDFGARYWWLVIVPAVALSARGLEMLAAMLGAGPGGADAHGTRALVGASLLALLAVATYLPWRAADKYHNYRRMRPDIREMARAHGFGRSLVLVRGNRHPDYASAAVYNPLDLSADAPVYAWDRNAEVRARVLDAYADRPVWVVDGPTLTGRGFELVAGPLPADQVAAGAADALRDRYGSPVR